MKNQASGRVAGHQPVQANRNTRAKIIWLFIATATLPGCFQHYFSTQTQTHVDGPTIEKLKTANKYFIIHGQNQVAGLENLTVSNETVEANVVALPPEHAKYIDVKEHSTHNVVRRKDEKSALSEVHLYTGTKIDSGIKQLSLPLSSINQVDVYEFNGKATKTHKVLSWVGIMVGVLWITAAILLTP